MRICFNFLLAKDHCVVIIKKIIQPLAPACQSCASEEKTSELPYYSEVNDEQTTQYSIGVYVPGRDGSRLGLGQESQPSCSIIPAFVHPRAKSLPPIFGDPPRGDGRYVVIAWNDLGMHCMDPSFEDFSVLPPYNNLVAQVVRRGEEPAASSPRESPSTTGSSAIPPRPIKPISGSMPRPCSA